jgi:His-Xaa-Ser system radical SAM maturase HxsC
MIKLHGKVEKLNGNGSLKGPVMLTKNIYLPKVLASKMGLILDSDIPAPSGYQFILRSHSASFQPGNQLEFKLPVDLNYLDDGDVVSIDVNTGSLRVLYRKNSGQNSVLLTDRCNHYCLMCSQPPKDVDDSWLLEEAKDLVRILPATTPEIGFTGGEPTLYGDEFIELMRLTKTYLPRTAIHILSNGRAFSDMDFAKKYASIDHPDMMIGIPLYSDDPVRHNYIVQARNAFDETVRGILNLKSLGQKVEIRVVIHRQSIDRLNKLCEFIARNLLFVDHVALMGLEIIGFTRANLSELWVDPYVYKDQLSEAVAILRSYGLNVSVYNHQRCLINDDILDVYRKSISDWKNEYVAECDGCRKMGECGGFFTSSKLHKYSDHIKPF